MRGPPTVPVKQTELGARPHQVLRALVRSKVMAISAVASVNTPGVLVTAMPCACAVATSMWLKTHTKVCQQPCTQIRR